MLPWARSASSVLAELGVEVERGLSDAEAGRRLRAFGPNRLRAAARRSAWSVLVGQLRSLIVWLLAAAVGMSIAFGDLVEAGAIAGVIVINTAIGFATELRACRSMEALRRLGTRSARVRRGGTERTLPATRLVPGDVVLVEPGDVLSADLRVVCASKLQADESALTGESMPTGKTADALPADSELADRRNMLFAGTSITRGTGTGVVVATGMHTELGVITALVDEAEQEATPLEQRLEALGRRLIWVTLAVAALSSAIGVASGKNTALMIETGIALAVAAIPEGLPIVATIALARGMWRMAHRNALINRLSAVETLGATSVIFTDKTGTLTENKMTVSVVEPTDARRDALELAVLCNNATSSVGDPLEVALVAAGEEEGLARGELLGRLPELREEPFDPSTRMMATVHADGDRCLYAVKGAAEAVLACATRERAAGGDRALDERGKARWLGRNAELAAGGLRVLAVASKRADTPHANPYADLTVVGLIGLLDPPRSDVREAIADCRRAGIRVVMVTGDQPATARAIAAKVGLVDDASARVVLGRELRAGVGDYDAPIFARVDPAQKLALIARHQARGDVVAMTGDGVNDAPALKKADIGVAMGRRGTEVAREASDMILKDDSFASIVVAVRLGRVIFDNIRKFVLYLLSCNVSEIMIVAGAAVLVMPLPLLPLQILFLNLVTDVFPALALGFGKGDAGIGERPPRDPREPIVTRAHWWAIFGYGTAITALVLAALMISEHVLGFDERRAVTVSFLTLAFAQLWHVFNMRGRGTGLFDNDVVRSPWVWSALAICTALILGAVYVPGAARLLSVDAPGVEGWALVLAMSGSVLVVGQLARAVARLRTGASAGSRRTRHRRWTARRSSLRAE